MKYKKILFAILPMLIVFISAEMALRISGWPKITASFEHNEPFWVLDPDLKKKKTPHKEENTSFSVNTNEDGLRTKSLEEHNKAEWKIMTMGCSTTFGWGVADSQAYPARLDHYIKEAGYTKTDVINAGQPGYTSFQGAWLWNRTLSKYKPNVVLIGFVVQDARKAAYSDRSQAILQKDYRFLKDNIMYNSRVYLGLRSLLGSVQIRAKERQSEDVGGIYRVPPEDYVHNLRTLVSDIQENGGHPVLFGYPLEVSGYTEEHRRILQIAAEQLNIGYFDPQERMETVSKTGSYYFPKDRGHANVAGNDLIAQWVFTHLKEKDLLGKKP